MAAVHASEDRRSSLHVVADRGSGLGVAISPPYRDRYATSPDPHAGSCSPARTHVRGYTRICTNTATNKGIHMPDIAGRDFDPAKLRKSVTTLDVETDYPAALNVGDTIHTASGFQIGTITDVVN